MQSFPRPSPPLTARGFLHEHSFDLSIPGPMLLNSAPLLPLFLYLLFLPLFWQSSPCHPNPNDSDDEPQYRNDDSDAAPCA